MDELHRAVVRTEQARRLREWRRKNPDKVRAQRERYWLRRAQKILAREGAEHDGRKD